MEIIMEKDITAKTESQAHAKALESAAVAVIEELKARGFQDLGVTFTNTGNAGRVEIWQGEGFMAALEHFGPEDGLKEHKMKVLVRKAER